MRSTLIIVIVSIVLILLPVWLLAPPLLVEAGPGLSNSRITRALSEPALAGQMAFGAQCAECHGALAEGGEAPGLLTRDYAVDFRDAPPFTALLAARYQHMMRL